ncbi:MAG TPA: hypothetical protein DCP90_04240 [Clostridiales bacterium]|nr:MAG: hypothetical protein A2Y22_00280 [Clostridiales bacterium GWD2_32_59]HAN09805.1 hypothetical protein [Clostridiales bacterium]
MKFDRKTFRILAITTQIGVSSICSILLGLWIGLWLDGMFQNKIWIIIGFVLGIVVAFKAVWNMLKELL